MGRSYDFKAIEKKWQAYWEREAVFRAPNPGDRDFDASKPKYYVLDMFPYPSGAGLHVGHPLGYIATDIVARHRRMLGYNVLHPMGFDSFGLPAEQYAVEHGIHPQVTTHQNIENMRRQLKAFGLSYDWNREVQTTDPDYYRWTQWIFLQLFNSYYDDQLDQVRPIDDLIDGLKTGAYEITDELVIQRCRTGNSAQKSLVSWDNLSQSEQATALASRRLAYLAEVSVNWCPALGTVLANEEVTVDGRSERGNHPVFQRPLKQWMLRITALADRLIDELDQVDWPEPIKLMQRNWIGRSHGAIVHFSIEGLADTLSVFTTRPDTLFGATYLVLAPEHRLVDQITTDPHRDGVDAYRQSTAKKSERERQVDVKEKSGVPTGAYAVNPVNGERLPIWIADYVLASYGTGAIMAVPAHDERDFQFAKSHDLPIRAVVAPSQSWLEKELSPHLENKPEKRDSLVEEYCRRVADLDTAFCGYNRTVNSRHGDLDLNDLSTEEAKKTVAQWLQSRQLGAAQVQYKLRDWLFSRQRYWGEPFPILHGSDGTVRGLDPSELPLALPEMEDFSPPVSDHLDVPPQPSLSRADPSWSHVEIDGELFSRELNTMPQWAGSCWYYLRFADPKNGEAFVSSQAECYWMKDTGVDLYVGGAEHAVLHLLYARFWHKVLFDLGHVSTREPFGRLFNQGYILAHAYQDERGVYVPAQDIEQQSDRFFYRGQEVTRSYGKMGKSLKNAVNPDEMFDQFGCDTLRLYEMYMGPLETSKPWNTRDIVGVHRFLQRIWRNFFSSNDEKHGLNLRDQPADDNLRRLLHRTIKRVTEDTERLRFNTAIAALIELNNALVNQSILPYEVAKPFVLMLAPYAPHIAEELWEALGNTHSLAYEPWPTFDPSLLIESEIELVVQICGKTRSRIKIAAGAAKDDIEKMAREDPKVARHLAGKVVQKVIHVPNRLVNIVAK